MEEKKQNTANSLISHIISLRERFFPTQPKQQPCRRDPETTARETTTTLPAGRIRPPVAATTVSFVLSISLCISFQDSPRVAFLTPEAQTQSIGVGFERGVVDCLFFVCMDLCDIGIPPSLFDFRLQSIHRRLTAPYV